MTTSTSPDGMTPDETTPDARQAGGASGGERLDAALTLTMADGGIAVAAFDLPDQPVNVLGADAARAFGALLDRLERDTSIRGAVLLSGKPDGFIAGADIEQFGAVRTAADGEALSRQGQQLVDRVERCRVPVVAAIHGAALGGGLEVALACAWRVATEHRKTVFALPEVQLGLIPGMGGTQRLPRRIGLQAALDMILTGKNVRARKALALGLIDDLVHPAVLRDVAVRRARELADGTRARGGVERKKGANALLLDENPLGRTIVFSQARERTTRKTGGHYPAPLAALDVVHEGYSRGRDAGLREEARRFGELAVTDVSRELVGLFFATTALKKDPGVPGAEAHPVRSLVVLGGGFMGAGIAALAARSGTAVRLKDADAARVGRGLETVRAQLGEALKRKRATALEVASQRALVTGTAEYTGMRRADLVIEAVFEDAALKRRVLAEVAEAAPHAVLATNTSTIPIDRIADGVAQPERVVGMHFFSPVAKMPLLEVVVGDRTALDAIATAVAYGKQLGKTVIVVRDGPGFYVNRILAPYIREAGWLLQEGVAIDVIDRALVQWGFPVGPFQLLDEVGLDVAAKSGGIMQEAFAARMPAAPALRRVLESGRLGRKNRQGFHAYDGEGKRTGVDASVYAVAGVPIPKTGREATPMTDAEIVHRCVYPMLDEAVRCLEDEIVQQPRDGDVGAVFGIGYPPFRGGPFRTIDALTAARVSTTLEALAARPGEAMRRFAPCATLERMGREARTFYERP